MFLFLKRLSYYNLLYFILQQSFPHGNITSVQLCWRGETHTQRDTQKLKVKHLKKKDTAKSDLTESLKKSDWICTSQTPR